MIDAVLFDLDGTLIDSGPVLARVLNGIRAEVGRPPVAVDMIRSWSALGADALVARAVPGVGDAPAVGAVERFRTRYAAVPTPPESLAAGARHALSDLRRRGIALALVSNKPEVLCRSILADLGLDRVFGSVVGGDTTGVGKPDPEPVRRALAELDVDPRRAAFVGDTDLDRAASTAAGTAFVWYVGLDPAPIVPTPQHVLGDYRGLGALLDAIAASAGTGSPGEVRHCSIGVGSRG